MRLFSKKKKVCHMHLFFIHISMMLNIMDIAKVGISRENDWNATCSYFSYELISGYELIFQEIQYQDFSYKSLQLSVGVFILLPILYLSRPKTKKYTVLKKLSSFLTVNTDILVKGQVKNNEATQKYCIQGIYSAVMAYPCEMYQRYTIFRPFCNTFASLFLTWPLNNVK